MSISKSAYEASGICSLEKQVAKETCTIPRRQRGSARRFDTQPPAIPAKPEPYRECRIDGVKYRRLVKWTFHTTVPFAEN